MGKVHALKAVDVGRSPEREALHKQIETLSALTNRREELLGVLDERLRWRCRDAVEYAEGVLEKAKTSAAQNLVEVTAGRPPSPALSVKEAQTALTDAQAALEAVQSAQKELGDELEGIEARIDFIAGLKFRTEIAAIITADPATERLLRLFQEKFREFENVRRAVQNIEGYLPRESPLLKLLHTRSTLEDSPLALQWQAAIEALRTSADAPLPTSPDATQPRLAS